MIYDWQGTSPPQGKLGKVVRRADGKDVLKEMYELCVHWLNDVTGEYRYYRRNEKRGLVTDRGGYPIEEVRRSPGGFIVFWLEEGS